MIGIGVGIVPGVGESVAPWVAYDAAKRSSKEPEKFGTGYGPGIIAPEVANNATSGGALIPMFVLGIPGSGTTAVLLAALFMYGVRPGPLLIVEHPGFIAKTIFLFWMSAVVFRVLSWVLSPYFIRLLSIRREVILPIAVALGVIGAWGTGFTTFDVGRHVRRWCSRIPHAPPRLSDGSHGPWCVGRPNRRLFPAPGDIDLSGQSYGPCSPGRLQ
ncbi:MAG: tripartite tricarboxylate transporter permease [Limnochordia bacterium]